MALGSPDGVASSAKAKQLAAVAEKPQNSVSEEPKPAEPSDQEPAPVETLDKEKAEPAEALDKEPAEPAEALDNGLAEASVQSEDSRHLQKAIERASQRQQDAPSRKDPPVGRVGRKDPPSGTSPPATKKVLPDPSVSEIAAPELVATAVAPAKKDAPELVPLEHVVLSQVSLPSAPPKELPIEAPKHVPVIDVTQRKSSKATKIEQACDGFDRVQEKIARLRMLLSSQDIPGGHPKPSRDSSRDGKRAPNVESLDSAFAKMNQIQSKMRALQTLVKSNRRVLEASNAKRRAKAVGP